MPVPQVAGMPTMGDPGAGDPGSGCRPPAGEPGGPPTFPSPEKAVREVNRMLSEEAWEALGRHYDLEGSDVTREEVSRRTWYTLGPRPVADPRGGSDAGEPFPPGSSYLEHEVRGGVARVSVELDPAVLPADGDAAPPRRTFFLLRTGDGWRLLAPDDRRIGP